MTLRWGIATCVAFLTFAACGGAARSATGPPLPQPDSLAELEALYRARIEESRSRFTAADARFMSEMIVHHAQAVVMAELARSRAAAPAVHALAGRIRGGQLDEIALMRQWLSERGQPVPDVDPAGMADGHGAGHGAHHVPMAGMLTQEQMRELERATGEVFDRLFLARMIEHHRGALVMVDALLATGGAAQDPTMFRLASDVYVDQAAEIARMQRLLEDLGHDDGR